MGLSSQMGLSKFSPKNNQFNFPNFIHQTVKIIDENSNSSMQLYLVLHHILSKSKSTSIMHSMKFPISTRRKIHCKNIIKIERVAKQKYEIGYI